MDDRAHALSLMTSGRCPAVEHALVLSALVEDHPRILGHRARLGGPGLVVLVVLGLLRGLLGLVVLFLWLLSRHDGLLGRLLGLLSRLLGLGPLRLLGLLLAALFLWCLALLGLLLTPLIPLGRALLARLGLLLAPLLLLGRALLARPRPSPPASAPSSRMERAFPRSAAQVAWAAWAGSGGSGGLGGLGGSGVGGVGEPTPPPGRPGIEPPPGRSGSEPEGPSPSPLLPEPDEPEPEDPEPDVPDPPELPPEDTLETGVAAEAGAATAATSVVSSGAGAWDCSGEGAGAGAGAGASATTSPACAVPRSGDGRPSSGRSPGSTKGVSAISVITTPSATVQSACVPSRLPTLVPSANLPSDLNGTPLLSRWEPQKRQGSSSKLPHSPVLERQSHRWVPCSSGCC